MQKITFYGYSPILDRLVSATVDWPESRRPTADEIASITWHYTVHKAAEDAKKAKAVP